MDPRRHFAAAAVALSALIGAGCATIGVSSFLQRGADFARYHTYAWAPDGQRATGDPRLDNNPFFQERIEAAVEQQLRRRGFEKSALGMPDLVVHYHASVEQRLDVNEVDRKYGSCRDCTPYLFDAGTLTIDFVDARTNSLVWRGWATDSIDGLVNDQARFEKKVDEAVFRILERLPPRL